MTLTHERTSTASGVFRFFFSAILYAGRVLEEYSRRRATMRSLSRLGDRDLQDIGVRRTSVGYELIDGKSRNPRKR